MGWEVAVVYHHQKKLTLALWLATNTQLKDKNWRITKTFIKSETNAIAYVRHSTTGLREGYLSFYLSTYLMNNFFCEITTIPR